jgi:multiple sugar transport system permease protein
MLKKVRNLSGRQRRQILYGYLFLTPQLILYLGLTIIPFAVALPMTFTDQINYSDIDIDYVGFDNYVRVVEDPLVSDVFWPALNRTAQFTLVHFIVAYLFGLGLALLMYEVGFKGGIFTIIYLPYMISGLALGFITLMLFSQSTGTVNLILKELGVLAKPMDIKLPSGTTFILPILVGWRSAGFYMAILLAGLLSIPRETIEASIVDGASYIQRLIFVYFPQMIPSFIMVAIFVVFRSFNLFDELVPLGGLYQNQAAEFISIIFFKYAFLADRLALGMTLAIETFIPLFIIGLLLQRLQSRLQYN